MTEIAAYDGIYDALKGAVRALGGAKKAGPLLRRECHHAEGWLLNCLNADHAQKLDPEQVILLLKLAQEAGFHDAMHFLEHAAGYQPSAPIALESQLAEALADAKAARVRFEEKERDLELLVNNPKLLATFRAHFIKVPEAG